MKAVCSCLYHAVGALVSCPYERPVFCSIEPTFRTLKRIWYEMLQTANPANQTATDATEKI